MMKNIEPIFVIIDDFSGYGETSGSSYTEGTFGIPGISEQTNVCLYDYGFVDFQENGVITEDTQAGYFNLTFPKTDVIVCECCRCMR